MAATWTCRESPLCFCNMACIVSTKAETFACAFALRTLRGAFCKKRNKNINFQLNLSNSISIIADVEIIDFYIKMSIDLIWWSDSTIDFVELDPYLSSILCICLRKNAHSFNISNIKYLYHVMIQGDVHNLPREVSQSKGTCLVHYGINDCLSSEKPRHVSFQNKITSPLAFFS